MLSPVLVVYRYRVVKLLQPIDCEETVHAHTVFYQQLDKVHPVHHKCIQHGLLQGTHLKHERRNTRRYEEQLLQQIVSLHKPREKV